MDYRRTQTPGGIFFFTLATYRRQRLFEDETNIHLLQDTIQKIKTTHPFKMNAMFYCQITFIVFGITRRRQRLFFALAINQDLFYARL